MSADIPFSKKQSPFRAATQLVQVQRTEFGEVSPALFMTSGFAYESAEQAEATFTGDIFHYQYTRYNNPTLIALEEQLAALEGTEACTCTASGMGAVSSALLAHVKAGERVVASRAIFGSSYWIVANLLPQYGIETQFVDGHDLKQWEKALSKPTAAILLETPSNPRLDILDLEAISILAHKAGALVVMDNVFATPLGQNSFELGADVVVYSTTKHIEGHGQTIGGAVLSNKKWIEETLQPYTRNTGNTMSPFNAWLTLKGMETMPLRVAQMNRNAESLTEILLQSDKVTKVFYPGHPSHPQYELAMRQMSTGGNMIAFEVKGGKEGAFAFMNALKLIVLANNLGDTRSLITHPATTTHMKIGPEERAHLGITDGMIRFSVGIEDIEDLKEDITHALTAVPGI